MGMTLWAGAKRHGGRVRRAARRAARRLQGKQVVVSSSSCSRAGGGVSRDAAATVAEAREFRSGGGGRAVHAWRTCTQPVASVAKHISSTRRSLKYVATTQRFGEQSLLPPTHCTTVQR